MLRVFAYLLTHPSAVGASIARLILYIQVLKAIPAEIPVDTNCEGSDSFPTSTTSTEYFPIVSLTVSYYWSLLEAGLALIAACLPPMSYLFTHFNIHSVINSIRSTLSLHSFRSSQHSNGSKNYPHARDEHDLGNLYKTTEHKDSTASRAAMLRTISSDGEERALPDLEAPLPAHGAVETERDVALHDHRQ